MRRHALRPTGKSPLQVGAVALAAAALALFGPGTALAAAPTPTPTASAAVGDAAPAIGPATPGETVCAITSTAVNQVAGMVATDKGIYVVNGAGDGNPSSLTIYTVDNKCKSTSKAYGQDPVDPQDLALGSDGSLWVCDCGDKDGTRERIALEKLTPDTGSTSIYRVVYPGGAKLNAKAMLLTQNDVPVIFAQRGTKVEVYTPAKALVENATTNLPALKKVGDFPLVATGTDNPTGAVGAGVVTGAAKSPDGSKVVVRTYSDAYEFDVPDGDIGKAVTTTKPRITPLPSETLGEAITYSADGANFLTLSWMSKSPLLKYTPYVPPAVNPTPGPSDGAGEGEDDDGGLLSRLTFSQMTRMVAAVGVVGLVLAIAGIVGIRRARRRRREEEEDEYDDYDDYDDGPRGRRGRGRGDDHAYADPRGGQGYGEGYGQPSGGGYGANGYGANGYGANAPVSGHYGANAPVSGQYGGGAQYGGAAPQYGADPYAQQYGAAGQYGADQYGNGQAQYGADQYGAAGQFGADQYGAAGQYGADPYAQQYGAAGQYAADQYGGGQYPAQYGADQYAGDQYGGGDYGAQGYGPTSYGTGQPQSGGGGYGYGYEDDFDPRRR